MTKLIFLDIDGVLNSTRSFISSNRGIPDGRWEEEYWLREQLTLDPISVGLINRIIEETSAKIVVSSSHRKFFRAGGYLHLNDLKEYIQGLGVVGEVISATPVIHNAPRGSEIKEFLRSTSAANYVIIDDSSDMLEEQLNNFVHTDSNNGFLFEDYIKTKDILDRTV